MAVSDILFLLFAALTLLSACVVVMSNRLTHAVFALLFTFFGVAGIYVFLGADFVAAAQVIVYVGGILVLLLFGVMLTTRIYDLNMLAERVHFAPSRLVPVLGFFLLVFVCILNVGFKAGYNHAMMASINDWFIKRKGLVSDQPLSFDNFASYRLGSIPIRGF